ncbi:hypothetical protein NW759_013052 [Fusarium solani]|uniref:Zn(2)-C6 fungal-type domain-containing protein n=1 Tax=Fusarium solani TaxID=169388 RepID=A0A9P9JWX1_FUSSL|nr:uncharacterized protein B0J15DRAFT_452780 [Fusarium solani]KAH7240657.1 hypothetical protein B0J15DRAFT_452780 [Fusarium solani]KAJ4210748.1 hypothetical protein NW759_013052 [Fusarium solani]
MRNLTACSNCRAIRKKCFRPGPGRPCDTCVRRHLSCSFKQGSKPIATIACRPATTTGSTKQTQVFDLSPEMVQELFENYVHYVLDRPHSLFHLPTLRTQVRDSSLKRGLLYAILAFGCRFHPQERLRSMESSLFAESKAFLHSEVGNVCLENIQTCVLLANLSSSAMDSKSEALYISIGIRMAELLGFDTPNPEDSPILRETKRRVWWTLYMADRWCSAGCNLRRAMGDFDQALGLPIDEYVFHRLDGDPADSDLVRQASPGLWAYNIMLAEQFGPIHDLNKQLVQDELTDDFVEQRVAVLAENLRLWQAGLPDDKRMSDENVHCHARKGLGGPFMALHTGFHHYSTLLFFQFLDIDRPKTNKSKEYAELCKQHAASQSRLIKLSREIPDCEIIYGGVGYGAVISSAVLLHMLMFGDGHDAAEIRAMLQSNFEAITELERYWPSLSNWKKRLHIFQETCLKPCELQTYKLDKWMVRFLLEHHLPLEDPGLETASTGAPLV